MTADAPRRADGLRRVVVTGIGLVSPLGIGLEDAWAAAVAGTSTAGPITLFDTEGHKVRFACEVQGFEPADYMEAKAARRMERFAQLGVAAARLAVADAGIEGAIDGDRTGAIIASGVGGMNVYVENSIVLHERGADRVSPLLIPTMIANMAAAHTSMQLGLRGPVSCTVTACAAANHAIGDATDQIRLGRADVMLAGGAEGSVAAISVAGFANMKALSTRNDEPARASRPFDADRDGFVLGECGAVMVLEELGRALSRGARIYCEVAGYGASGDAHHLTEPDPSGLPQAAAIRMALAEAGAGPEDVDYVNAHGTSTPVGDPTEVGVVRAVLGEEKAARTMVSSTKSMHGHCLGAAGGIEGALTALAIQRGVVPPTINLDTLDPACAGVDHVTSARAAQIGLALSNAFGFGGHNATIALARFAG